MKKRILVVVDMQNDFIDGALGTPEAQAIVPRVADKIRTFDGRVLVTMDTHSKDYLDTPEGRALPVPHCIELTDGWQIHDAIYDALDSLEAVDGYADARITSFLKYTFGSTRMADDLVLEHLAGPIDEIIFVGLCTDICVVSNALLVKAFLPDVKLTADASCCAGVTPESHNCALATMKMCQINIENWEG